MSKDPAHWPNKCPVPDRLRRQIETASRKLSGLCIRAGINLSYTDRDGLRVRVDLPKLVTDKLARPRRKARTARRTAR